MSKLSLRVLALWVWLLYVGVMFGVFESFLLGIFTHYWWFLTVFLITSLTILHDTTKHLVKRIK